MKLVDNVIRSMRCAKVFRDNQDPINNMHFSSDGSCLISSADDDQVGVAATCFGTQYKVQYHKTVP